MNWRTLKPSTISDALPPPGDYQGKVIAVKMIDKPTELWLQITYGLRDYPEEIRQFHCIAAAPGSPHIHRVTDGKRALNRVIAAGKLVLEGHDPMALPKLLTGTPLTLTVAHKTQDGVAELVLRNISPAIPEA